MLISGFEFHIFKIIFDQTPLKPKPLTSPKKGVDSWIIARLWKGILKWAWSQNRNYIVMRLFPPRGIKTIQQKFVQKMGGKSRHKSLFLFEIIQAL